MSKSDLRLHYKDKRRELGKEEMGLRSMAIAVQLIKLLSPNLTVHLFLPISRFNEVDTYSIKTYVDQRVKNCKWVISKSDFTTGQLEHIVFNQETVVKESEYGIPEPIGGSPANVSELDVVLVPLLAFDKNGHRLGYGKGFYDRFLEDCPVTCKKIGLSFFEVTDQDLPTDPWDIALDYCITPNRIYTFK